MIRQSGWGSRQLVIEPSIIRYSPSPVWSSTRPEKSSGFGVEYTTVCPIARTPCEPFTL